MKNKYILKVWEDKECRDNGLCDEWIYSSSCEISLLVNFDFMVFRVLSFTDKICKSIIDEGGCIEVYKNNELIVHYSNDGIEYYKELKDM